MMCSSLRVLVRAMMVLCASAWFNAGLAQNALPRVGMLMADKADQALEMFSDALATHGWIVGKNVIIEFRDGHSDPTRINGLIDELTALPVQVIFPIGPVAVRATYA